MTSPYPQLSDLPLPMVVAITEAVRRGAKYRIEARSGYGVGCTFVRVTKVQHKLTDVMIAAGFHRIGRGGAWEWASKFA